AGTDLVDRLGAPERETLLRMAEGKMHQGQELNSFNLALQINDAANAGDASKLPAPGAIKAGVESGQISPAHGLSLIGKIQDTAQSIQENTNAANAVKAALANGLPIDNKNKLQMWAADNIYQSVAAANVQKSPDDQLTAKAMFASQ